jgi:DNA-binding MarR family transcriptional regulator
MLQREIRTLQILHTDSRSVKEIAQSLSITNSRANQIVRNLIRNGFLTRKDGVIEYAPTAHATLLKRVAKRYDLTKLLSDSKEEIALALLDSGDINKLQKQTGKSYWTLRRSLNTMMETGALKQNYADFNLSDDEDLRLFLKLWREEKQRRLVETYAEIAYYSHNVILKKVPQGRTATGTPTAYSAFNKFGVEIRHIYDYYIQPPRKIGVEEILIHALVFSTNPIESTDCAVFYAKNRDNINLGKLRITAKDFGVEKIVADLENYVRNHTIINPERFLPWSEFAEKTSLYGINIESILPPAASPNFMTQLSDRLEENVDIYIIGGEAMRIRGLKRATKDIDVLVEDTKTYLTLVKALHTLGYTDLTGEEINTADRRLNPSGIFVKEGTPRMDIFVKQIMNTFTLTESMKHGSSHQEIGRLRLHVISNENLFLLKTVTEREGDLYDMAQLAKTDGFSWADVLDELLRQERESGKHYCNELYESLEIIENMTGIKTPIRSKLETHVLDHNIFTLIEQGKAETLSQIKEYVKYSEYRLTSSLKRLIRQGKISDNNRHLTALTLSSKNPG